MRWIGERINEDHPRACGEQVDEDGKKPNGKGSSPRVRGAGHEQGKGLRAVRIIPARAGSSLRRIPARA